jgi:hypothetical protein
MRISAPVKAVIVAVPVGVWLTRGDVSSGRTLAFAVGAALVTFGWVALSARPVAEAVAPAPERDCSEQRHGTAQPRIARTPTGRGARDVRCAASQGATRARRSTRR